MNINIYWGKSKWAVILPHWTFDLGTVALTCKSCPGHILGSTQIDRLVIFGNIIIYQISCAWECFVPQLSFNLGLGLVNLGWAISLKLNMIRHVTFPIYLGIPIF